MKKDIVMNNMFTDIFILLLFILTYPYNYFLHLTTVTMFSLCFFPLIFCSKMAHTLTMVYNEDGEEGRSQINRVAIYILIQTGTLFEKG